MPKHSIIVDTKKEPKPQSSHPPATISEEQSKEAVTESEDHSPLKSIPEVGGASEKGEGEGSEESGAEDKQPDAAGN